MLWISSACGLTLGATLWLGIESVQADEAVPETAEAGQTEGQVGEVGKSVLQRVLPTLPAAEILSPSEPELRPMTLTIIEGDEEKSQDVQLPEGATVAQALQELALTLGQHDRLFPAPDAKVYHQMRIRITRVEIETRTRTANFAGSVQYRPTTSLKAGQAKLLKPGKPGVVEVTERIWSKDGKVTLREEISRRITQAPQDKVVGLGVRSYYKPGAIPYHKRYARSYSLASRGGSPRDRMRAAAQAETLVPVRSLTLTATGYSPDPRENGGYTTTATGLPIGYGAAAVDPRVIPLGTKLYVEGYGYAFACDVGGAIKGHRIDLAYDSYRLANTKGRKKVKVWILAPAEE